MEKKYKEKLIYDELLIMDEIDKVCKKDNLHYFLTAGTLLGSVRHGGMIPWDDDMDIAMPRDDFDKFVNESYKKMSEKFFLDYYTTNSKYFRPFAKVRIKGTQFKESTLAKDIDWCIWIDIFPLDNISEKNINKAKSNKKKIRYINMILAKKYGFNYKNCKKIRSKLLYVVSKFIPAKPLFKLRNKYMTKFNNKENKFFINYGSQYSIEKQLHEIIKYFPTKKIKFENRIYNAPADIEYVLTKIYGKKYMELPPVEKRISHDPLYIKFSDGEEVIFDEEI